MDKRALSLPILTSLVVGNMIGTGIYVLPASLAQFGSISLLAWIYTSIGALFLALTLANLNKRFPLTGGPYVFCKEAFGKLVGFIVAYIYWASNLVSIAGIAVASVGYLGFVIPFLNSNSAFYNQYYVLLVEIGVVWIFTSINLMGVHAAGLIQLFLTIIKILPLIIVSIWGFRFINLNNFFHFSTSNQSHFSAFINAATLTFWAFVGLESATIPAENTQGYQHIYKATVYGTLVTALIYLLSTFVLMGMIPAQELESSQFPFALAGTFLFGSYSAILIALCAVISGLGAMNVCILIQGQIAFAAARDQIFPKNFAKLSKNDVPILAQLFSSSLVTLFLIATSQPTLLKQFDNIALFAALLTLITYFMTTLAELKFIFMSNRSMIKRIWNKAFIVSLLGTLYSAWMISSFDMANLFFSALIILLCVLFYFLTIRRI